MSLSHHSDPRPKWLFYWNNDCHTLPKLASTRNLLFKVKPSKGRWSIRSSHREQGTALKQKLRDILFSSDTKISYCLQYQKTHFIREWQLMVVLWGGSNWIWVTTYDHWQHLCWISSLEKVSLSVLSAVRCTVMILEMYVTKSEKEQQKILVEHICSLWVN